MENIFFIVLVALVGLIRLLSQIAEKKKNAEAERRAGLPAAGTTPVQRAPAQSEEERIRRFMEALGVPTTSTPPPPVQPRTATPQAPPQPKRQFMPVDPFPIPRQHRAEPTPPVVVAPPPVVPAAPPPLPAPLPTRETSVFAEQTQRRGERIPGGAEFEVQDLFGAAAEREDVAPTQKARRAGEPSKRPRGIAARLANAESLRDAIVLREIFGPPRSMQPLDPVR